MTFDFPLLLNPSKKISWNPDTHPQNAHLMITGGSGSGKTRLCKHIINYLHGQSKQLHVIDIQNTLSVDNEKVFPFLTRNSNYSINPFEFTLDEKGGGPAENADQILSMFQKTFMKRLKASPALSAILRKLIEDTYKKKGIIDSDISTWGFGLSRAEQNDRLPTVHDMLETIEYILDYISGGYGVKFGSTVARNGAVLNNWHREIERLSTERRRAVELSGLSEEEGAKELQRLDSEIAFLREKIQSKLSELSKYFSEYLNYSFLGGDTPTYETIEEFEDTWGFLDFKYYSDKDRLKTIKIIQTYLVALAASGVFGKNTPDISFSQVNRYDLSAIKDDSQIFAADTLIAKLFRMLYLRGEFRMLPEGEVPYKTRRHGVKADTFFVIDEMQALLPNTTQEINSKQLLYTKVIGQVRNFGGSVISLSQSVGNFPEAYLNNVGTQIVLYTNPSDIPKVRAALGIKDQMLFKHLEVKNSQGLYSVGIMKDRVGDWHPVMLPWYSE